jgi:hypothetical protein
MGLTRKCVFTSLHSINKKKTLSNKTLMVETRLALYRHKRYTSIGMDATTSFSVCTLYALRTEYTIYTHKFYAFTDVLNSL